MLLKPFLLNNMLEDKLVTLLQPIVDDMGFLIVDIEKTSTTKSPVLKISIEPKNSDLKTTIDDCVAVSKVISPIIDAEDVIDYKYRLEVGSAGIDRPLKTTQDFIKYQGYEVDCRLKIKDDNNHGKYRGVLLKHDDEHLYIELGNNYASIIAKQHSNVIKLARSNINKINLTINDKLLNMNSNKLKNKR
jgi:ribosome maturation factor RimP